MSISTYAQKAVLQYLFGKPGYMSLHTFDPGKDGGNEVGKRQLTNFTISTNKVTNKDIVEFPDMPKSTITHVGIWDANGNFIWGGSFVKPKSLDEGDTYRVPNDTLTVVLD